MQENLIGFLLGALDGTEHDDVSRQLEKDPQLRQQLEALEARVAPLETHRWQYDPPEGLAAATCELVLGQSSTGPEPTGPQDPLWDPLDQENPTPEVVPRSRAVPMTPVHGVSGRTSDWSLNDLVITAGIFLAAGLLFLPAINRSVDQARRGQCAENLREVGVAAIIFSENHQGYFPRIPVRGNLAAAGMFGATLWEAGLITEPERFLCPGNGSIGHRNSFRIPTQAAAKLAQGPSLRAIRSNLGGDYGYHVGYLDQEGQLRPTRNQGRSCFALVSDEPRLNEADRTSKNHRGGQNVLFEAGNIRFMSRSHLGDDPTSDDFFQNDDGLPEAGTHPDDSVILPSQRPPVLRIGILLQRRPIPSAAEGTAAPARVVIPFQD